MRSSSTAARRRRDRSGARRAHRHPASERARRLIAIEYDRALAALLRERYARRRSVEIVEADVLDGRSRRSWPAGRTRSSATFRTTSRRRSSFTRSSRRAPERAVYLVQREVAERIVRAAGDEGVRRAVGERAGASATPKTLFRVPRRRVQPPPKVESAVVRSRRRATTRWSRPEEEQPFRAFVQGAFGMRRKQMRRVLRVASGPRRAEQADALLSASWDRRRRRPESLSRRAVREAAFRLGVSECASTVAAPAR